MIGAVWRYLGTERARNSTAFEEPMPALAVIGFKKL
jgi:hypothetical protein